LFMVVRVSAGQSSSTRSEVVFVEADDLSVLREQTGSAISDAGLSLNKFVDGLSLDQAFIGGVEGASEVFVSLVGVDGFGSYRRFLNALSDIDQVASVRLEAMKGDQMMFRISYAANHDRLISAILRQIDLEQLSDQYGGSGTKIEPYLLAVPGYRFPEQVEQIFSDPTVGLPAAPILESEPLGPLLEP